MIFKMTKISLIAAVSLDGVIGVDEQIPWRIPEDFKIFRETTMGNVLIVGRKTYETLPPKAFEGRKYVVVTNQNELPLPLVAESDRDNIHLACDTYDALLIAKQLANKNDCDIFVIGGSTIYSALIDHCDEAYITWVNKFIPEGNKFFPMNDLLENFDYDNESEWTRSKTNILYKTTHYIKK